MIITININNVFNYSNILTHYFFTLESDKKILMQ